MPKGINIVIDGYRVHWKVDGAPVGACNGEVVGWTKSGDAKAEVHPDPAFCKDCGIGEYCSAGKKERASG